MRARDPRHRCGLHLHRQQIALGHRIDRENRLLAALADGDRTIAALLDAAWPEVPEGLRPLATATLAAHLDKLAEEGALPAGVERPTFEGVVW